MPQRRNACQPRSHPFRRNSRSRSSAAVRAALAEQQDLLQRLTAIERKRVEVLHEADEASRDLERLVQAARAKLTRFLLLDTRSAEHKDGWRVRTGARVAGIASELEGSRRSNATGTRTQALLARACAHRCNDAPCIARSLVAYARVALARRRDLRALSDRPRPRSARDHVCARAARPDGALDRGRDARPCARQPILPSGAWRCAAGDVQAPACDFHARMASRPERRGSPALRLGRGIPWRGRARPAQIRHGLRAALLCRGLERTGSRAVRQPREPGASRFQSGDDYARRIPRAPLPDAAAR